MKNTLADFMLTEDAKDVRNLVHQYVEKKVKPIALEMDRKQIFPRQQIKELADLGIMGCTVSEKNGGSGLGSLAFNLALEEISRHFVSLALSIESSVSLCMGALARYGTEAQKEKYLYPAMQGEKILSFALTEPQSGSDAGGTQTTAVQKGDKWVINGAKSWITNCEEADAYLTACKTDKNVSGSHGISLIIVDKGAPGISFGKPEEKLSVRASKTGQIFFSDCEVPAENLTGPLNQGFPIFMEGLDEGRIAIGAISLGLAEGAMERAVHYAKNRFAFGKCITSFQDVAFALATMEEKIETARSIVYTAASMYDAGIPCSREAAIAKVFASETGDEVTRLAIQVMGANGLSEEYEVERFYRDSKLMTIGEGTTGINKLVISRHVLQRYD